MLTVNLEKELIRQNKKIGTPEELLKIREYERLGDDICESEILNRIGLNESAKIGKKIIEKRNNVEQNISKYNQERVFHISQIKSLCTKYHLRFLKASLFIGVIDKELPNKISNYEVAYNERCDRTNTYIAAPMSSFKLEKRPKDPLFFKSIGNDYYYLIHKWGNDLSIFRRCLSFFKSSFICYLSIILPLIAVMYFSRNEIVKTGKGYEVGVWFLLALAAIIVTTILFLVNGGDIRFVNNNEMFDSEYR